MKERESMRDGQHLNSISSKFKIGASLRAENWGREAGDVWMSKELMDKIKGKRKVYEKEPVLLGGVQKCCQGLQGNDEVG